MKHNKPVIISIFLVLLNINVYSQKDTTICFELNSIENQNIKKNVLGLDIFYHYNLPMFGINYERIVRANNTISFSAGSSFYPRDYYDYVIYNGKIEPRFYFPGTSISTLTSFKDDFYLQKKKHSLIIPEGLFIGIVATYKDFHTSDTNSYYEETHTKFINSFGIGASVGYQFLLFNKISANISLPLILENSTWDLTRYYPEEQYEKTYFDLQSFINFNLGIAF